MKILVYIKQVPGSNNVEIDSVTGVLKRNGKTCNKSEWNGIYVYADHANGKIHRVTHELCGKAKELAKEFNVRSPNFGHAGDGNLHVYICKDSLDEKNILNPGKVCF